MTEQPPDDSSPEARAYRANAAFRRMVEAIEDFERAQAEDVGGSILVDWLLVTASHFDPGDGTSGTAYGLFGPDELPAHRVMGLIEYARVKAIARAEAVERGQA